MEYDFTQINDKELESLVVDLLSDLLGVRFERFKSGRDGGVDGRYFVSEKMEVVLQTKHYFTSGVAKLINVLERQEKAKVEKLKPTRYLLATSCKLSRSDKSKIFQTLKPYIVSENDIFGAEDLNDLLRRFPNIEKAHNKLWMSSTALLRRFLNNGLIGRSEDFLKQVADQRKFYADTQNFHDAQKKLEKSRVLIISGEPGVGKTTIAENLSLIYASEGFEIVDVVNIIEAEAAYQPGERQFFLFDDFLGGNYFEAISGREDSHIVKFMRRISVDETKRFVLTSRTNILNLGVNSSDPFGNANIRRNEYLLKVGNLSNFEKAEILYNHLWHGGLQEEYVHEIYKENRYLEIIRHRNYSPRLVHFVTDINTLDLPQAPDYWKFIVEKFEHPALIWKNALKVQSNNYIRLLIKLIVFNGGSISEESLKIAFRYYCSTYEGRMVTEDNYVEAVAAASGSFIIRSATNRKEFDLKLFNPSIADYVLNESSSDTPLLSRIFDALPTTRSLTQLLSIKNNGILKSEDIVEIVRHLNASQFTRIKSIDFRIKLVDFQWDVLTTMSQMQDIVSLISEGWIEVVHKEVIFNWLRLHQALWPGKDLDILKNIIAGDLDYDEARTLGLLLESREAHDENPYLVEVLHDSMSAMLEQSAREWAEELDLSPYVQSFYYDEGEVDFEVDRWSLEREMLDFGRDYFSGFPDDAALSAFDQFRSYVDGFDFDEIAGRWLESRNSDWEYEGGSSGGGGGLGEEARIHDLFNRG
ncbi:hypothetical protein [Haloferula sp. BvORR071]|uniref:nSTAND3 domain-containing NTPase n=1 Tax=Haloferula sp. BvORR071 TaxID=1396141 RepID=UPI00069684CC|nr:hypothetical protein [Haloferula sp. BvORR071]